MSIAVYGFGLDLDVVGGAVAYGFGINALIPPPPTYIPIRFDNRIAIEIRSVDVESQECQ